MSKKIFLQALILLTNLFLLTGCTDTKDKNNYSDNWVGTWGAAQQLVEPHNNPPEPGISNNTLRQIVRVSIGGDVMKIHLSNEFSKNPLKINMVTIASHIDKSTIDLSSQKEIKFNNLNRVEIPPYKSVTSDPAKFKLQSDSRLAITIYFDETPTDLTGHPGSRTTSYLLEGDNHLLQSFENGVKTDHWYVIKGIDVETSSHSSSIVVLGNSITDGRGSGTNKQNRWTDVLSQELLKHPKTKNIGVLNMGIGGNCVLKGGLGPTALDRFENDVLKQKNARWLIILEGINDIGGINNAEDAPIIANDLIKAYKRMIDLAHMKNIKVYGATILPFAKSFYDNEYRQNARDIVNNWIRNSNSFDAVIDFDIMMQNPDDPKTILPDLHDNDFLHPNEKGYEKMGKGIDLNLFK
ncbi:MAG: SGNH/GDSL hydrolase family protein [Bacteroidales bacterium]|nr:SGNH/GDSL hydrolase family protein [Bacteroidales bacterium]